MYVFCLPRFVRSAVILKIKITIQPWFVHRGAERLDGKGGGDGGYLHGGDGREGGEHEDAGWWMSMPVIKGNKLSITFLESLLGEYGFETE